MGRAKVWIFSVLGVVAALAVAVILVLEFATWNWLRPPLQAKLSQITGKSVKINGDLRGQLSWTPHITLADVQILEPKWQPNPEVARVKQIDVTIDLGKLLRGTIDIPDLEFEQPLIDLERTPDGKANWDVAEEASGPKSRSSVPVIGLLKVTNGHLKYNDPAKKLVVDATLQTAQAQGGSGQGGVQLQGSGTYQNAPFTVKLAGDPLDLLRDTKRPYNIDIAAKLGATDVRLTGTATDPVHMTGLDLKLALAGQNAADLYTYLHVPAPQTPPFNVVGQLDKKDKIWMFKDFSGTVGHSDLAGSLAFDTGQPRLLMTGELTSKHLALVDTGVIVGVPAPGTTQVEGKSQPKTTADKPANQADQRVLPDLPLNLDEVRNVDVDVRFKGEKVIAPKLPLQDVSLRIRINNGVLSLDPLHIGVAGGEVAGTILIDARKDVKTDYDLRFTRFQLQQFFDQAGKPGVASGSIDGRVKLEGVGDSIRKSLGSANGTASWTVDQGSMSKLASELLGLDIARSLGVLVTGDKQIPLACVVADFQVSNGDMTPRTLVLDTADTLVTGKGDISLTNEALNLEIKGTPKKPALTLGGPIDVSGPFRKPSIKPGAEAVARSGAAVALGALISPFAAVIAFIHPGTPVSADCQGLEQQASAQTAAQPLPNMGAKAASHPPISDAVKQSAARAGKAKALPAK